MDNLLRVGIHNDSHFGLAEQNAEVPASDDVEVFSYDDRLQLVHDERIQLRRVAFYDEAVDGGVFYKLVEEMAYDEASHDVLVDDEFPVLDKAFRDVDLRAEVEVFYNYIPAFDSRRISFFYTKYQAFYTAVELVYKVVFHNAVRCVFQLEDRLHELR